MRVSGREDGEEATPGRVGVGYHLQQHLVARRDERSRLEGPAEAAESLATDVSAVNIHVVIATEVVILQIDGAE